MEDENSPNYNNKYECPFTNIQDLIDYLNNKEEHKIFSFLNQNSSSPKCFGQNINPIQIPETLNGIANFLKNLIKIKNRTKKKNLI